MLAVTEVVKDYKTFVQDTMKGSNVVSSEHKAMARKLQGAFEALVTEKRTFEPSKRDPSSKKKKLVQALDADEEREKERTT